MIETFKIKKDLTEAGHDDVLKQANDDELQCKGAATIDFMSLRPVEVYQRSAKGSSQK